MSSFKWAGCVSVMDGSLHAHGTMELREDQHLGELTIQVHFKVLPYIQASIQASTLSAIKTWLE